MHGGILAHLQLTGAMVTVGSTGVASKIIGQTLDPFLATALRFAFALPVFAVVMCLTGAAVPRVGRRDGLLLVGQAAAGSVGYTVLLIAGTRLTSAADAAVIIGTLPAATAIAAVVLLGERLSRRAVVAVAVATAGVLMVVAAPDPAAGGATSLVGDALVLGAVFCECVFILLNKRLSAPVRPLALSMAMAMAAIGLVVSGVATVPSLVIEAPSVSLGSIAAVIYYALVPTVLGFWLWYSGSQRVPGGEAAVFTAVAPVTGVLPAWLTFGEPLTLARLGGLVAAIAAVLIVSLPGRIAAA